MFIIEMTNEMKSKVSSDHRYSVFMVGPFYINVKNREGQFESLIHQFCL